MHVEDILSGQARDAIAGSHALRRASFFFAVNSLLEGGRLGLTQLGRATARSVAPKHTIKRIDRLLGNHRLHAEVAAYSRALAAAVLGGSSGRPVILVDWTRLDFNFGALVAAVPSDGRALVIHQEVYPLSKWANAAIEKRFLDTLASVLPEGANPILVTDSGYQTPWFRAVAALGWSYVGRLGGSVRIQHECDERVDELYAQARRMPRSLGACGVTQASMQMNVVLGAAYTPKRRRAYRRTAPRGNGARQARKRAVEPWVLVTDLTLDARDIVNIYGMRMQIEESFRDTKNHRFGWSLRHTFARSAKRYEVLLLIAAFAALVVTMIGRVAETAGHHREYQANTIKKRRVLSLFYLGKELLRRWEWVALPALKPPSPGENTWKVKTIPGDP